MATRTTKRILTQCRLLRTMTMGTGNWNGIKMNFSKNISFAHAHAHANSPSRFRSFSTGTTVGTTAGGQVAQIENNLIDTSLSDSLSVSVGSGVDFSSLGLASPYSPSGWVQSALEFVHVSSGMPWWASLVLCSVFIRFALFPIAVKAQQASVVLRNLQPLIDPIKERGILLQSRGDNQGAIRENQKVMQVFIDNKVNPLSGFWGLAQMPIFISCFFGIKGVMELPVPGLETGGFGWIMDLSAADPFYILPVASSVSMLLSFEANKDAQATVSPAMKLGFRCMALLAIPFFMHFPAGLMLYTFTNGILQILQVLIFQIPGVRRFLKLELTSTAPLKPKPGLLQTRPLSLSEARKQIQIK